jgi:hypothetical protein
MVAVSIPGATFWLSMHVPYACRHSGACCSSGWPIPIERARLTAVSSLRADRTWLLPVTNAPADVAGILAVSEGGRCVFHRDGCEIQHAFGHQAIPAACQHFPRDVLIDPRGIFVTLSHYCPTAADLLFTHAGPVEIVQGPAAIPAGEPEGLDARDVLPPLLTEGVLMDYDGYSAWESHVVAVLTRGRGAAEDALAQLEADLAAVQAWRPGRVSLSDAVRALAGPASGRESDGREADAERVIRRYLAARAFASWLAYRPEGVAMVLRGLRLVLGSVRNHMRRMALKEAIRQTDLQVLHLQPRDEVARAAIDAAF